MGPLRAMGEWLALILYQALTLLLLPAQVLYLLLRSRRSPGYRLHWSERFWGQAPLCPAAPRLWVHAVSVGETQAAIPLIRLWLDANPAHQLLLTHTTVTGRDTGARVFASELGARVVQAYLPYDLPWAVERFLARTSPRLGLLMETESWPLLLRVCQRQKLPVALINGRLSERSARRMRQLSWLARPTLQALSLAIVQAQEHADRFAEIAPDLVTRVSGSMKFDLVIQADRVATGERWRSQFERRGVVLLASSREAEETAFLLAWKAAAPAQTLLVIVPRHPERFDWVAQETARLGLSCARRSDWGQGLMPPADREAAVLLGDSLGEMQAYVAMSDCVVVGGSLIALGGQNPIEACAQGRPLVMGPHMYNFPEIARELLASGAAQTAQTPQQAIEICGQWLNNGQAYTEAAQAGLRYARAHQGASARTLALLQERGLLPSGGGAG